jgi:hypothetical protein
LKRLFLIFTLAATPAFAQHEHHTMPMPGMQSDAAGDFLMAQASGTSHAPGADPMTMTMQHYGDWMLMLHGSAFLNATTQTGPRGRDQLFTTNWLMASADRPLFGGHLMLRTMLSAEPLFMPQRGYTLLFQTGETAHGRPIVDSQHPHDLFMELAAEFAVDLGDHTVGYVYAAPVGDPALGPVAYPHRASAQELPQATLAHHLEDSTHIANSVLTIGAKSGAFGFGVSGFHGAEPDENRYDIDGGGIDSWSVRGTWDPSPNMTLQLSTGHLRNPEALEPGDVQRTTASLQHYLALAGGSLATSVIWGHNHAHGHGTNAFTAEANWKFRTSNYLTGRMEVVDKDELGDDRLHTIRALTVGYTKDVFRTAHLLGGVGGNVTVYGVPSSLRATYGSPTSWLAFVRVRSAS